MEEEQRRMFHLTNPFRTWPTTDALEPHPWLIEDHWLCELEQHRLTKRWLAQPVLKSEYLDTINYLQMQIHDLQSQLEAEETHEEDRDDQHKDNPPDLIFRIQNDVEEDWDMLP